MSFRSPYPDVAIPDVSLYDLLFADLSADDAQRVALVDGTSGAATTYGELRDQVDALAGSLSARGLGPGDVVGIFAPNLPAWGPVFHGTLRAGASATTINALFTADDVAKQLIDAGAKTLFTISAFLDRAVPAAQAAGLGAEDIVVIDGAPGYPGLADLLAQGHRPPHVFFDPAKHVVVLPYSSGTTGKPKGVMLSHRNLVANVAQIGRGMGVEPGERILAVLPLFHIYGLEVLLNMALKERATLVTMPKFDLAEFLRVIADHRVAYAFIAPPIAVALAKHPLVDEFDLSGMHTVFSGAAPLDGALAAAVATRLPGVRVRQGYGMSELSPVSHSVAFDDDLSPAESVGRTIPNMECKLIDPVTGTEVAYPPMGSDEQSEPGELWVRGPNVMLGYLNNPEATAETPDAQGFLHTGDIATVDGNGAVRIVDRLKELIKYKGYQVPPAELEALLLTHPQVADAAVIGVRDEAGEEVPKAFVVRQANATLTADELMDFVAQRVSPHKKVRDVEFIDAVPKSAAGKILRRELRRPLAAQG